MLVALAVGGVSGFIGGRLDLTVQRLVDAWMSIPGLLILLTVMSVVGRGVLQIIVVLGVLGGIGGSRVVRGAVIAAKEQVYFEAARAVGSSRWRTLLHLLPNIAPVLIVIYSINIGAVVISEASLSFLGFGLPTTVPSWGGMLSREGREYMEIAPRLAVWPGLCLTVGVYCLNMVGDAVRDLLDPRLRGGSGRLGAYGAQAVRTTGSTPPPALQVTHPACGPGHVQNVGVDQDHLWLPDRSTRAISSSVSSAGNVTNPETEKRSAMPVRMTSWVGSSPGRYSEPGP